MRWVVLVYFMNILAGCQTLQPAPKQQYPISQIWAGKIYVGDSKRQGVAQSLLSPVVSCTSVDFDRMVCMSLEDYTALMQYFIQSACVNQ